MVVLQRKDMFGINIKERRDLYNHGLSPTMFLHPSLFRISSGLTSCPYTSYNRACPIQNSIQYVLEEMTHR